MSECVVRMEMPKDKNCLLNFNLPKIGPWCWIEDRACDYYKTNNRPDWCPIICQLPEGHGRLVDADKLADDMKARKAFFGRMSDPQCLVEDARTIVPAERSET